jgi:hypothetical protein
MEKRSLSHRKSALITGDPFVFTFGFMKIFTGIFEGN